MRLYCTYILIWLISRFIFSSSIYMLYALLFFGAWRVHLAGVTDTHWFHFPLSLLSFLHSSFILPNKSLYPDLSLYKIRNRKSMKFGPVPDVEDTKRRRSKLTLHPLWTIQTQLIPSPTPSSSGHSSNRQELETPSLSPLTRIPIPTPDLSQSL